MIAIYGPKIYALAQREKFIANVGFVYGATSVNRDFLGGSLSSNFVQAPSFDFRTWSVHLWARAVFYVGSGGTYIAAQNQTSSASRYGQFFVGEDVQRRILVQ